MTNLGATQVHNSGQFYRSRYVENGAPLQIAGIASDDVRPSQIWASAPDQYVLYQTATNFFQGLYPPLSTLDGASSVEQLANSTEVESPLGGYQFILVHGEDTDSPDRIWIKGDDHCPAYENASDSYFDSSDFQETLASTSKLYSSFVPLLGNIMGPENVTYRNAYDVFDLLNVASIHDASVAGNITAEDLTRLQTLANQWEWNRNFNASNANRSIGGKTLAGGFLNQLTNVVEGNAATKFSLMAGSYDTFLSFFGLTGLQDFDVDFTGIPDYAASMAFELYSEADGASFPESPDDNLMVRFLFRNGTDDNDELVATPLFGETPLTWGRFRSEMSDRAILSVGEWCDVCSATEDFCLAARQGAWGSDEGSIGAGRSGSGSGSELSNTAAGAIGAGVTLAVLLLVAQAIWVFVKVKRSLSKPKSTKTAEVRGKEMDDSDSEYV